MLNLLKIKITMMLVTVAVIGGISVKNLPTFPNVHTTIKKSQDVMAKETYKKEETQVLPNAFDDNNNLDLLSDVNLSTDKNQYNNGNTNKQERVHSNLNTTTSEKEATIFQVEENSKVNDIQDNKSTTVKAKTPTIYYDRTTSIYDDDRITLLRVEYYVNNKLTYYSVVEQFDATTLSYVETIYQCDLETNNDPLIRTDVYVNGSLVNSY